MPYSIRFTPHARRDFSALDRTVQQRLQRHMDRLAENPFPQGAKKLHAEEPYYRIRVGDYRVIYTIDDAIRIVEVRRIAHRRESYE